MVLVLTVTHCCVNQLITDHGLVLVPGLVFGDSCFKIRPKLWWITLLSKIFSCCLENYLFMFFKFGNNLPVRSVCVCISKSALRRVIHTDIYISFHPNIYGCKKQNKNTLCYFVLYCTSLKYLITSYQMNSRPENETKFQFREIPRFYNYDQKLWINHNPSFLISSRTFFHHYIQNPYLHPSVKQANKSVSKNRNFTYEQALKLEYFISNTECI